MSYILDSLSQGERIQYEARVAWAAYFPLIAFCIVFSLPLAVNVPWVFGLDFVIIGYVWLVVTTTELAVTDRRVVAKVGLISRTAVEIPLAKVESVSINQTVVGRLLGYGSVVLHGTGGNITPFKNIADPMALRKAATQAIEDAAKGVRRRP